MFCAFLFIAEEEEDYQDNENQEENFSTTKDLNESLQKMERCFQSMAKKVDTLQRAIIALDMPDPADPSAKVKTISEKAVFCREAASNMITVSSGHNIVIDIVLDENKSIGTGRYIVLFSSISGEQRIFDSGTKTRVQMEKDTTTRARPKVEPADDVGTTGRPAFSFGTSCATCDTFCDPFS